MPYIRNLGDDSFNDGSSEQIGPATSTSNETVPAGGYISKNGVCKATDDGALAQFKELQRQINRVLDNLDVAKIAVDGAIGAGTLSALKQIAGTPSAGAYSLSSSSINMNDCTAIAAQVLVVTMRVSQLADYLGAPSSVSSPSPPSPPTIVNPATGVEQPQGALASAGDLFGNMSTTEKLGVAGLAVAVGYFAIKGRKR